MLKVGLTGGIGCGKSTAVDAFRRFGVPVIDADQISKDIVKPGSGALAEIKLAFGEQVLDADGGLNRIFIKDKVFNEPLALEKLEGILHPRIRAEIKKQISSYDNHPDAPSYLIVDVPLLVEKNYQSLFDRIIVVDCTAEQQLERVLMRDSMDKKSIKKIMDAQATGEERKKIATDILDNTSDVDTLRKQINNLHQKLVSLS